MSQQFKLSIDELSEKSSQIAPHEELPPVDIMNKFNRDIISARDMQLTDIN